VELYRFCVKGNEIVFKSLPQPSRFVCFSTVQKVLFNNGNYVIMYNYVHYYIHYIYKYSNITFHTNPSKGMRTVFVYTLRDVDCNLRANDVLFPVQFSPL